VHIMSFTFLVLALMSQPDTPFVQEYHEAYPLEGPAMTCALSRSTSRPRLAATRAGLRVLADGQWTTPPAVRRAAYAVAVSREGESGRALGTTVPGRPDALEKAPAAQGPISAIALACEEVYALGLRAFGRMWAIMWRSALCSGVAACMTRPWTMLGISGWRLRSACTASIPTV